MIKIRTIVFGIISIVLIIIWITMLGGNDPARVWRGLLINYLFFVTASAGLMLWPAIVVVSEGDWMEPLEKISRTGIILAVPSVITLIVLWIGSSQWAPWVNLDKNQVWLNTTFLFLRNLVFLILYWIMVYYFIRNRYKKSNITFGSWLIVIYSITFSLAGFDLVMSLNLKWHSMMMGGYFFIDGLYTAAAAWALMSILSGNPDKNSLLDIGRLIVTFSLLTTYLMYSQLLPIWYENLPDETPYLIPLFNLGWKGFSYLIICLVYLGPLVLLMSKGSKRNYWYLGFVSFFLLIGLWIEKWWLVASVFEHFKPRFGWYEIVPALIFLSLIISGWPLVMNQNIKKSVLHEQ